MQFLGVKKWCSKHVCWKFVKSERFLVVLREHIIFNVKWVDVRKLSEIFWGKLYFKTCDLFCKFLLALKLSARKYQIKKTLMISTGTSGQIWKFCMSEISRFEFSFRIPLLIFLASSWYQIAKIALWTSLRNNNKT